ncbi:peptidyl-prolyl cis-trans isomerase [Candidatus Woesearchaeota archaeon]|nr:peptidyl-prolyl cis-trans isomerase [Candidatus Woesearchaeota archaeon]
MKTYLLLLIVLVAGCNTQDKVTEDKKMNINIVAFETNMGNFEIELYPDKAPITVRNFIGYVNDGFYDGLIFHRVIDGFMVQGGGFTPDMEEREGNVPIKNEADNGLKNGKYTIAMARTNVVDSATSQFFINTADNTFLDHGTGDFGYAVFGKVVKGQEVIDKIGKARTTSKSGYDDVPAEDIIIKKATLK